MVKRQIAAPSLRNSGKAGLLLFKGPEMIDTNLVLPSHQCLMSLYASGVRRQLNVCRKNFQVIALRYYADKEVVV